MAENLPYEILALIAIHVKRDSGFTCALVCKHWTEPFLNAYWNYLSVDKRIIKQICSKSNLNNVYLKNAQRVRKLHFEYLSIDDIDSFSELQQVYQSIKRLEYFESYKNKQIFEIIDWNLWKPLSHLKISFEYKTPDTLKDLFTKLSVLPCLTHFTLKSTLDSWDEKKILAVSWSHIESLHLHLSRLEYLDVDFMLASIPKDDMELIKKVTPAHTVTNIRYNDYIDAPRIFYFALKYPNLRSIEFGKDAKAKPRHSNDYDQQQYLKDIRLLSTLDQFFPCLKNVHTYPEAYNRWPFSIFCDTLQHFGVNTECVKFHLYTSNRVSLNALSKCLKPIAESLRISWQHIFFAEDTESITDHFILYPNLVELHMDTHCQIEIDVILNKCPVLRLLDIKNSRIRLSGQPQYVHNDSLHPLQKVEIKSAKTSTLILEYISFHCRQLKFMKLDQVWFNAYDMGENGQLLLDIGFSQLKTLILYNIRSGVDIVSHCVIEQMGNTNRNLSYPDYNEQPVRSNWYYICLDESKQRKIALAWELEKSDVEFAKKYCKDFVRRKNHDRKHKSMEHNYCNRAPKKLWKKDLQYGVFVVRSGSVENYFLDSKRV